MLSKVQPKQAVKTQREWRCRFIFSLTLALDEVDGQRHPRLLYLRERDPVLMYSRGWAPRPVWTGAGNSPPPGFYPRTVQPVASFYTDYAIPVHCKSINTISFSYYRDVFIGRGDLYSCSRSNSGN
jgi:hypothetical protein